MAKNSNSLLRCCVWLQRRVARAFACIPLVPVCCHTLIWLLNVRSEGGGCVHRLVVPKQNKIWIMVKKKKRKAVKWREISDSDCSFQFVQCWDQTSKMAESMTPAWEIMWSGDDQVSSEDVAVLVSSHSRRVEREPVTGGGTAQPPPYYCWRNR